jgi:hypothetical protein
MKPHEYLRSAPKREPYTRRASSLDIRHTLSLRACLIALVLVACAPSPSSDLAPQTSSAHTAAASIEGRPDASAVPQGPSPTTFGTKLGALGLDVQNLPALHDLDSSTKLSVMQTFTDTLGVQCGACHTEGDYAAPTPQQDVATQAWEDIVRKLAIADGGGPLYCDSCHRGTFHFLDRSNRAALQTWMQTNFVEKLQRKDGEPMACSACHSP